MTREAGGYSLTERIYESINSAVYRGIQISSGLPVVLKFLKQDYPEPRELARYRQEYEITRNLDKPGIIKAYALQPHERTLFLVLEDFGASSLRDLMRDRGSFSGPEKERDLQDFLRLAIKIAEALGHIHAANIIHKDINLANIVCNSKTGQVKVIDFGISTILTRENPTLKHPNVLEGTLAYMSPEQTGRMNRLVDYRTDFYSLGVTFYELLTGQLPFVKTDAMELVHCHIAKQPMFPHKVLERQGKPALPLSISRMVMKLMAKTAENRYQSAWGIKADLEECLRQLEATGRIEDFPLGSQDISDKFQIPQKLYGREKEVETLLAAFERVSTVGGDLEGGEAKDKTTDSPASPRVEMLLVAGQPGIGKSALVQEVYKPITKKQGYFISGKFDQFQRNIPYSALVNAFQGLVRQLLAESSDRLINWKNRLLSALQPNTQVIIDVIPEVESIVGKQPEIPPLGAVESQNRFNSVFRKFIGVFCQKEHPLVIFLDDLQWVDLATLKLIEVIIASNEIDYLLLVGAYRDNEVSSTHPFMMSLESWRQQQAKISQISLDPLTVHWIGRLIAETFKTNLETAWPLAQLVRQKTQGNPFFVSQFLKTLNAKKLITFDPTTLSWQWDVIRIESQDITDNVVEMMIENVRGLPKATQKSLRFAACIGSFFDLHTLAIISERSSQETFQDLLPAIQSGLILPISELDPELLIQNYKFSHDRIQQAAHESIGARSLKEIHLNIGRLLQANLSDRARAERIFEIADHLNDGRDLIASDRERIELASLNLEAGKKAKESTAYTTALEYLTLGAQLLPQDNWDVICTLAAEIDRERAEAYYLNGDFAHSKQLIGALLETSNSDIDKAEIYSLLVLIHTLQAQYLEAIQAGRKALELLSIDLPQENISEKIKNELSEAKSYWGNKEIASLAREAEMTSPEKIIAVRVLMQLLAPAYLSDQDLFALIATKSANLSFQYGPTPESVLGYSCYGTVLSRSGNYESGYEFGLMSLELTKRFNDLKNRAKACNLLADHLAHWVKPLASISHLHDEGYEAALISGDLQYAGYLLHSKIYRAFASGRNIEGILEKCSDYLSFTRETQNFLSTNTLLAYRFAILNLLGKTDSHLLFQDAQIAESQHIENMRSRDDLYSCCFFYILKLQILFLYGEIKTALSYENSIGECLPSIRNHFQEVEFTLYLSLCLSSEYKNAGPERKEQYLHKLEKNLARLEAWAANCPENFLHKYLLVKAEICKIEGKKLEAMELYDSAIATAMENRFTQDEALANELAAKFWLERRKPEFAGIYLKRAHHGYQLWGATRKVKDLERKYPELLEIRDARAQNKNFPDSAIITTGGALESLDLGSVLKASQTLSGEIELKSLLAKLMNIAIENAGASRGFLLLGRNGNWTIEAEGSIDREEVRVLESIPIESQAEDRPALLSRAIVNYVARSLEAVVLDDATHEGPYTNDPYIIENQIASILCIPLLNQGNLHGILYLENNLTKGAFTADRIEVLQLLSSQAAISLSNARLYVALRESERNLAQFLEGVPVGILVLRETGELHYMNRRAREILGRGIEAVDTPQQLPEAYQLYVAGTDRLYPPENLPGQRALKGETLTADDLEVHRKDRIVPLEVWATPIFDERGRVTYAIAAFKDITQSRQAEAERIRFNQELAAKNVALEQARDELAKYSQTLEQMVSERTAELASANARITALNEQLKAENVRMEAELNVARHIQQMILPKTEELERIEGLDIACFMEPADEVAGDYYDVLRMDDSITLGIGDVTGHGLESGLLMLMAQTAVRTLKEVREPNPVKFLGAINRAIYHNVRRMNSDKCLTLAIINYSEGRVTISGQHEETLVVRADGRIERIDTIDLGLPIGLDGDIEEFIGQTAVDLQIGDGIVLYTDGIPEALNLEGRQYGMERFCTTIQQSWGHSSEEIKQLVMADVRHFIGEQIVCDDIALLVLKRK